ncbi:DUF4181 domain-containing protein [Bacillus sp. SCS-153A]|uniref:DUF4181 domain-containing protein n=1 Tax=Rossellomorea sedimentorum TaxID=3115294 RepID=UPI003905D55A
MFWVNLSLVAIIVFILISIVKLLLRKIFKIEKVKRKFFSYNYINDSHRKVDKWLRMITAIISMILGILLINNKDVVYLYSGVLIFLLLLDYAVRVFFELKFSEYPKQAVLTLAEMFLMVTAVFIVFQYWFT